MPDREAPEALTSRARLRNLARRTLGAIERAAADLLPTPEVLNAALLAALRAVAAGDLTFGNVAPVADTHEGEALGAVVHRLRALVTLAREALRRNEGAVERVGAASARVADLATRQRLVLDRAAEDLGKVAARVRELEALAAEVGDAADRAALLALNAGIEGMRAGGEAARALTALGDEIRRLSQRAATGAADLAAGVADVDRAAGAAVAGLDDARATALAVGDEATRAAAAADAARRGERDLAAALDGYRLLDEETEALVAGIAAAADKLARDLRDARARLRDAEPGARGAVEGALDRLVQAVRDEAAR